MDRWKIIFVLSRLLCEHSSVIVHGRSLNDLPQGMNKSFYIYIYIYSAV